MSKAKLCWIAVNPLDESDYTVKLTDPDRSGEYFYDDDGTYVEYQQYVLIPVE